MITVNTTSKTGIATNKTELTSPPVAAEKVKPAIAIIGANNPTRSNKVRKF